MSPTNPHIISQLRQLIYYHLDCNLIRNALFLAGRLHAYEPRSPEAAYLLALCHLRLGQLKAAYEGSRTYGSRGTHLGCSYVFAQACLGLEKYTEGITAIDRSRNLWSTRNSWSTLKGHIIIAHMRVADVQSPKTSIPIPEDKLYRTPRPFNVYRASYGMHTTIQIKQ